ncbi:MAG: sulfite exporter TauE/SafE family protein [Victivallales bacterium]|nr:sulfite exporter TauE/SafE family protein [Victivallales bacterium]
MWHSLIINLPLLLGSAILGGCVGVLTGLFGAGGGFIITPALNIILGLPMNLAVGTSACQVTAASAFALYEHLDRRLLGSRVALFFGIGVPFGAWSGAQLVRSFKNLALWHWYGHELSPVNVILLTVFAVLLLVLGLWMLYDSFVLRKNTGDVTRTGLLFRFQIPPTFRFRTIPAGKFSIPVMALLGLLVGFFSGMLGIGGGVIILPILFYLVGQETKAATQTSMMLVFAAGLFSTWFHAFEHNINYPMAAALLLGAVFGVKVGAWLQRKISGTGLRQWFGFVVLAAWLLVIVKLGVMLWP